jgi:hypothetical protein
MDRNTDGYEWIAYNVRLALGAPEFRLEGSWRDITKRGDDATTWHVLEGDGISFRVTVTGRTAETSDHPLPPREALKLAMLLAVRDEIPSILRSDRKLEPGRDYPVTVSREHLAEGEQQAARLAAEREVNALTYWQWNDGREAPPPRDGAEWVAIIRQTVPRHVRVVLTSNEKGAWWISVADEFPVHVGPGPWPICPIDHRVAVRQALRSAGKPVLD